jgi:hypothetical protein
LASEERFCSGPRNSDMARKNTNVTKGNQPIRTGPDALYVHMNMFPSLLGHEQTRYVCSTGTKQSTESKLQNKYIHTYIHIYIPWIHNFVTRQEDVE